MKIYNKKPIAIFLMGTTASGKTELAIKLKKLLNCELISVDSAMVYRYMNIGTAKPKKIYHELIDIRYPYEIYSVWNFRNDALKAMKKISTYGKIPILVGGTMFYFNILLEGIAKIPVLKYKIEHYDKYYFLLLKKIFKKNKLFINNNNDIYRNKRFLEVYLNTNKFINFFWQKKNKENFPCEVIKFIVTHNNKDILYKNIFFRLNFMLESGLITEVEFLKNMKNMYLGLPAMQSIGYRQVWEYIDGKYNFFILKEKLLAANRNLAKKQKLWLRKFNDAFWLDACNPKISDYFIYLLKSNISRYWIKKYNI
ncbi:tRNA dimethylallyltransferase [Candidatus Portiera aleyrodidarum]|uniref:tRNA (adenosine(37)-N6)-dimethylallyltransferase MiaA n=1 Tax=Candidatus Portiera aleyrodidarum TaxID=91844 RepID=UPI0005D89446|nr:tRNA (adenosine(37)-N6)-dimethylallyltransferase MiaA [Candidatus Portiera aleyrodidarum]CEL12435.1 tRNA dimethylallyltransferase [Candidatus Portiera aleyrodidarum]